MSFNKMRKSLTIRVKDLVDSIRSTEYWEVVMKLWVVKCECPEAYGGDLGP